jgi:hypothetical protein
VTMTDVAGLGLNTLIGTGPFYRPVTACTC